MNYVFNTYIILKRITQYLKIAFDVKLINIDKARSKAYTFTVLTRLFSIVKFGIKYYAL